MHQLNDKDSSNNDNDSIVSTIKRLTHELNTCLLLKIEVCSLEIIWVVLFHWRIIQTI